MEADLLNFRIGVGECIILALIDGDSVSFDFSFLEIVISSVVDILNRVQLLILLLVLNENSQKESLGVVVYLFEILGFDGKFVYFYAVHQVFDTEVRLQFNNFWIGKLACLNFAGLELAILAMFFLAVEESHIHLLGLLSGQYNFEFRLFELRSVKFH